MPSDDYADRASAAALDRAEPREGGEDVASSGRVHARGPVRGAASALTDIVSMSAARGLSIVLALFSVTIVTHLVTPSQYSVLAYIGVISGLMVTATASWTATAVTRYGRAELEETGSVRGTSWGRLLITGPLLVASSAVVVALKFAGALPSHLAWRFVFIAVGTGAALTFGEHALNLLEACGRMKLTAAGLALQRAVAVIGVFALLLMGVRHSPATIGLIWLICAAALAAGLTVIVWRLAIWPARLDRALLRRIVSFSLPLIAFSASQYVIQAVDILILGAYRPTRDVGLYAIAYQGYGSLQQLATTASIVLSPLFVSLSLAAREHLIVNYYDRMVPQLLLVAAVGAGAVASVVGVMVPLVFGGAFAPAGPPLAILLLSAVMFAAATFVAPILVLYERARDIAVINVAAAVVNVGGDFLLIGAFHAGITAPAIVTAVSVTIVAVGYFKVAGDCIGRRGIVPTAVLLPALLSVSVTLAVHGALRVTAGVAATAVATAIVLVLCRPFAARDADLISRLNMPAGCKRCVLAALKRLG